MKKWHVVEDYEFGNGQTDMRVFPYDNKTFALATLTHHYSRLVNLIEKFGWEITESCLADDHAWLSTNYDDHMKISVREM